MERTLETSLQLLSKNVEATAISAEGKRTVAWCLGKLSGLYSHYHASHESRYGDEIGRLVQAVIKELTLVPDECPAAHQIAMGMSERFQLLHERLGLPTLMLRMPAAAKVAQRKKKVAKPRA